MNVAVNAPGPLTRLAPALPGLPGGAPWDEWRGCALARLQALGLPSPRDEAWKYTNLRLLERRELAPAPPRPVDAGALEALVPALDGARLVLVDGRVAPGLTAGVLPAGLRVTPLATAMATLAPEALAGGFPLPGDDVDQRVRLLNSALLTDGLHLQVDGELAAPLHLIHASTGGGAHPRVIVDLAPHARLTLVEHRVPLGEAEGFAAPATEIRLQPGACLEHVRVQLASAREIVLDDVQVQVDRDARYVQLGYAFGGQLARAETRVTLAAPGAHAELHGLFMVDGSRQLDNRTLMTHAAPRTTSVQVFRGVASGRARGVYDGKIVVAPGAAKSESSQSSRNLLLSPQAEIDSRPQLEILTDDVKCAHGATTGQLDEDMLFYLLSRGIDRATARGLLTFAFAEDVIAKLAIPTLRRSLEERVVRGLPDAELIREFV
ncbi:MAG: Fe-S cluster assembly protein SufD [Steroidobacteraceae bacterium]|nr:Fe-S cluster assembly protein SufD [Steroidobacteraceae bacterium]